MARNLRRNVLTLFAISVVTSTATFIGIMLWDWPGPLIFVVPLLATLPLGVVFELRGDKVASRHRIRRSRAVRGARPGIPAQRKS